jgi:hypothetical protein
MRPNPPKIKTTTAAVAMKPLRPSRLDDLCFALIVEAVKP